MADTFFVGSAEKTQIYLDERLRTAAEMVRPGSRVVDVGCDHGKLSVFLAQSGRAAHVIATDVRAKPLARAGALVEKTGCGSLVECRLADGLSTVSPGEVDTVVIAGMSGITMMEILSAAPWVATKGIRLVLVPASKDELLRAWLWQNGFLILQERAALVAGYPYAVMSADYTGVPVAAEEAVSWLGLLAMEPGEAAEAYRRKALHRLNRRLQGCLRSADVSNQESERLQRLYDEVKAQCIR